MAADYIVKSNQRANLDLDEDDFGVLSQSPVAKSEEDNGLVPVPGIFRSLKKMLASLGKDWQSGDYIPTTTEDIYAKSGQKYLFEKPGKLILPENPKTADTVRVADFNQSLKFQNYFVLDIYGKTIAKNQIKSGVQSTTAINLSSLQGWRVFDFVYYSDYDDWAIYLDGYYRRFNIPQSVDRPYVYTTEDDLKISPYDMVGIDKPGNILLWEPTKVGEYATITDGRKLLANQDVYVVAPDGHLLGVDVVPADKISTTINLRNPRGANWFRVAYLGDQKWEINWLTKN